MKTKSIVSALLLTTIASSPAFSRGIFDGIRIPGISIPPITDWKIGGTLGKLWEDNKAALTMAAAGNAILGPFGLVYGLIEGHKTDAQKAAVLKLKARMEAEQAFIDAAKAAAERWPDQAQKISNDYVDASNYLAGVGDPQQGNDELEEAYIQATVCIINAQDKRAADSCKFEFAKDALDVQQRY